MIEPVIEVYFDPCADRNGIQGCFCARLRDYHKLWGNGATPTEAVRDTVRTIISHADMHPAEPLPKDSASYTIVRLNGLTFEPLEDVAWDDVEDHSCRKAKDVRQVAEIMDYLATAHRNENMGKRV